MRALVIAPHPDDETLGAGGCLLRHRDAGDAVSWLVVTRTFAPDWSTEAIAAKDEEIARVAEAYRFAEVFRAGLPTTRLDTVPEGELIAKIREAVEAARPELVYVNHRGDVHGDHRAVFAATMAVLRPFHMQRLGVKRVLAYEALSSTDAAPQRPETAFAPTVYQSLSPAQLEEKLAVMALYASEVHEDPLPRGPSALRALARTRGATIASEYAEAFELVREIG